MTYTKQEQKEHRQTWVKALREGEYEQTDSVLRDSTGFCCMGVACDIYDSTKWALITAETIEKEKYQYHAYVKARVALPTEVQEYLGLSDWSGSYFNPDDSCSSLVDQNDWGIPFHEIADIIESEPRGLLGE